MATRELIEVRSTVTLSGLQAGRVALVDPSDPYVQDALVHGWLLRTEPEVPAAVDSPGKRKRKPEATAAPVVDDAEKLTVVADAEEAEVAQEQTE